MLVKELEKQEVKYFQPSFNREQLIEMAKQEIYKWLATSHKLVLRNVVIAEDENKSCMRLLREQRLKLVDFNHELQAEYKEKLKTATGNLKALYEEVIEITLSEEQFQLKSNIKFQKELYKEETNIFNSRTALDVPLNRLWDDLYDDMSISCLFYDDISTLDTGDMLERYEAITDDKERMEFVKKHIEITHIAIQATDNDAVFCELYGETVRIPETGESVAYKGEFLDFNNLTLQDTMSITNQDTRQFIQSKMNLDNEPLEVIDEQNIRGDIYTLKRHAESGIEYIKFVCPSTQRGYYVEVDRRNFEKSKYYKKNDIKTVLPAWWSLTHLNANPYVEKAVPRC